MGFKGASVVERNVTVRNTRDRMSVTGTQWQGQKSSAEKGEGVTFQQSADRMKLRQLKSKQGAKRTKKPTTTTKNNQAIKKNTCIQTSKEVTALTYDVVCGNKLASTCRSDKANECPVHRKDCGGHL